MKVSKKWLRKLVDLKISDQELVSLIPLRIQGGIKEDTPAYFELDLKGYNRADLLSLRGVANEVAALTDTSTLFTDTPESDLSWNKPQIELQTLSVEFKNKDLCPSYCLLKIEDLAVGPSAQEWVDKLADSGIRAVNNLTDITNLIMLEYGQPLHAFDANSVKNQKIIVRTATKDEQITTLDGKKRTLTQSNLLITDAEKPLGIAGVMGGQNSEITDQTTTILLEGAIFDPVNIRQTANRLGLTSEASKRFIHGLSKQRLLQALDAAVKMYQQLGGKLTAILIDQTANSPVKNIPLRLAKLNQLIGLDFTAKQVEEYLKLLRCEVSSKVGESDNIRWEIARPYDRLDLEIEEDLIEEVARLYGYEKIAAKPLVGELPVKTDQSLFELKTALAEKLVGIGLTQVQTYSFFTTTVLTNLVKKRENLVRLLNPISSETEYMRDEIWPNLLEATVKNLKAFEDVAIFEIGKVYSPTKDQLPKEEYRLSIALANGSNDPISELIAIFQQLSDQKLEVVEPGNKLENSIYHPTRQLLVKKVDQVVGELTEVHPRVVNSFGENQRIAILELELTALTVK